LFTNIRTDEQLPHINGSALPAKYGIAC